MTAGGNAGENINVMLNSDGVTATVVFTNNAGDLVLRVLQVFFVNFRGKIRINGIIRQHLILPVRLSWSTVLLELCNKTVLFYGLTELSGQLEPPL